MEEMTIGQRIAAMRRELGISQIDLGDKMGVSRQSVSKWEADGAIPEIDKLIALSKLFGVSVGWLLGVENDTQTEEPAETEFSDREWEIIDRLTQPEPKLPKWLLPLTAGAAALSLIAAILAGAALGSARSRRAELSGISQSVADLTASLGAGLQDTTILESCSFTATPGPEPENCTFRFRGIPPYHEEGLKAELLIVHGGETVIRQECTWTDGAYQTDFSLPIRNGYTATFCLTDGDGITRTSRVYDFLLYSLADQQFSGDISAEYGGWDYDGQNLTFADMHITVTTPGIYRDTPYLWEACDLVVLGDGRELGRLDLIHRSAYSESVNFGGHDVDFFTREQSIPIGSVDGISELEVQLVAQLSTGMVMQNSVAVFHPANWMIP